MSSRYEIQTHAILAALRGGKSITPLEALSEFNCMRLAARIYDLRRAGHDIATVWETDGSKRWARYTLISTARAAQGGKSPNDGIDTSLIGKNNV